MERRLAAIGAAALFALLATALPPVAWLSGASVALVTLRRGPAEGVVVATGAVVVLVLASLLSPLLGFSALGMVAVLWLPVWLLAGVLRGTVSLRLTLEAATALALAGLLLAYAVYGDPSRELVALFRQQLLPAMKQMGVASESLAHFEALLPKMERWAAVALVVGLWLGWNISLLLGRAWQAQLYNPGGFREEFLALRLHRPAAMVALLAAAAGIVIPRAMEGLVGDVSLLLVMLFLFQGLAVVHAFAAWRRLHRGWLVGLYAVIVLMPSVLLLMAMLGILDVWRDFRRSMGGAAPG